MMTLPHRTLRALGAGALAAFGLAPHALAQIPFQRVQIDQTNAGDVKLVGDIDLDGTMDVVLGGAPGEGLNWYHYPTWVRTRIAVPRTEFTTDGAIGDVDGDGDLDLVVPDGSSGDNLLWFENPTVSQDRADGDPFVTAQWRRRVIGSVGSWCKDVELADYDGDGRLDVAARERSALMIFFRDGADRWTRQVLPGANLGREGLASGDVDGDGRADLVVHGHWLRNPGGAAARSAAAWTAFAIDASGNVDPSFKALIVDLDQDGRTDVLFSSSEATADVAWYAHRGNPAGGTWTRRVIATAVERAHTLQAGFMDEDRELDVVVGQMHTASNPEIFVFRNRGSALSWTRQVVDVGRGIHNGVVADLGGDGDFEIVGSNWTGNPPLQFWENLTPQPDQVMTVTDLTRGRTALIRISNVTPGAIVVPWVTLAGTTTPYNTGLGTDFDLAGPSILAWDVAGPNGVADFHLPLPPFFPTVTIWFQSLEIGHKSNVVAARVR